MLVTSYSYIHWNNGGKRKSWFFLVWLNEKGDKTWQKSRYDLIKSLNRKSCRTWLIDATWLQTYFFSSTRTASWYPSFHQPLSYQVWGIVLFCSTATVWASPAWHVVVVWQQLSKWPSQSTLDGPSWSMRSVSVWGQNVPPAFRPRTQPQVTSSNTPTVTACWKPALQISPHEEVIYSW